MQFLKQRTLPARWLMTVSLLITLTATVYWNGSAMTLHPGVPTLIGQSVNSTSFGHESNDASFTKSRLFANETKDLWWEEMTKRVCPNMVPQSKVSKKLFQLARQEVSTISPDEYPNLNISRIDNPPALHTRLGSRMKNVDTFAMKFYAWFQFWDGLSRRSDGPDEGLFSIPKMWKVANNQIDGYWRQVFEHLPDTASKEQITRVKKHRGSFANRLIQNRAKSGTMSECMVIVLRDPISHFLSGYNEVEYRIETLNKMKKDAISHWPCGVHAAGTVERFQQFLIDLLSYPIERRYPGILDSYPRQLELQHVYSMSGVLELLAAESKKYNISREIHILPTINDLTVTLGPFISKSCPNSFSKATKKRLKKIEMNTTVGEHQSSGDPFGTYAASQEAFNRGGPIARALCAMHLMDYACWRDLADGVPQVCMDLFHSYGIKGVL